MMPGEFSPLHRALQLPAGGEDVTASGLAHVGGDALAGQRGAECFDRLRLRRRVLDAGAGVPGDQVDLGGQAGAADEAGDLCAGLKTIFGHGPPVSPF